MKKFIFVTGPSESGKSGGVNYLSKNYGDKIKHLKIRNIFPEVYKDSNSTKEFQEWYDYEFENNFESLWDRYILKADEMSDDKEIVIMDTMYGVKTIKYLYSKLRKNLGVLFIDADFKKRVEREYNRLRTDSEISDRKADLTITMEEITEKTKKKDAAKRKKETFEYRDLVYFNDTIEVGNRNEETPFSYLIDNNGTLQDFYNELDNYAISEIEKKYGKTMVKKIKY